MSFESLVNNAILARAMLAAALSLFVGLAFGRTAIGWLRERFREPIKSISPTVVRLHQHKQHTPTMGGIFLLAGVCLGTLLLADLNQPVVLVSLSAAIAFAILGACDDLVKLRTARKGISARVKLASQFAAAIPIALLLESIQGGGLFAVGVATLVLVIGANAVNVTDGLDGLAAGCGAMTAVAMTLVLALTAQSELSIVLAALAGTLLAFLRFNRHPAQVFMGDTGSQMIGALLATCALASGSLLATAIYSGVFLIELASVALQLASYRVRGRRLFLCAPIHHHFQFAGWTETQIVRRFWCAAALFAVAGLAVAGRHSQSSEHRAPGGNLVATSRVERNRAIAPNALRIASVFGERNQP